MKNQATDVQHPSRHFSSGMISKLALFLIFLTVLLLVIIYPPFEYSYPRKIYGSAASSFELFSQGEVPEDCNLFTGEWIPDPNERYYTNETCPKVHMYHHCLHRRPNNTDYLRWRWKPDGCELPLFNPHKFLELVRGKSIAFIGDSMSRNQIQSLGCLLSRVAVPEDVTPPDFREIDQDWVYTDYNFNATFYWAPYLVHAERHQGDALHVYLDKFDDHWTSQIEKYDYLMIAAGRWFPWHPTKYLEKGALIGCYLCKDENVTHFEFYAGYQKAYRTALRALWELAKPGAVIFVRTISPDHFENGNWNTRGECVRTRPYNRGELVGSLTAEADIMRGIQLMEMQRAEEEGKEKGVKWRLFDVTESMAMRPDGHPAKYDDRPHDTFGRDCVHWCLPGPVDVWNDMLLQFLIRENREAL